MLIDSLENKQKILDNFLKLCVFDGWSDKTLEKALEKSGIQSQFSSFIFENGALDVADFFIRQIDKEMQKAVRGIDFTQIKIRDKIRTLVKIRLKINQKYKVQLAKMVQFYTSKNAIYALKNAYKTADLMWRLIGDNSTDFNFYSKRIILAKIYIRVIYCFAHDKSENNQKTLNLLDEQIEKVMKFSAFKFKVKNNFSRLEFLFKKASNVGGNFCSNPKNLIKKLPFFRLYK
jgi:ubiquinone biosynthesis protein COQ9